MPDVVALIPAAGSGRRFGGDVPKVFLRVDGRTLLQHSVSRLAAAGVRRFVIAVDAERRAQVENDVEVLVESSGSTGLIIDSLHVVLGGADRQGSVGACLEGSGAASDDFVLVHDAARPAVAVDDVKRTIDAASSGDGAVLGRSLTDTLKRVDGDRIVGTVDRTGLFRAETPQVFRLDVFRHACAKAKRDGFVGTDEASLVERDAGLRILRVEAQAENPKLTHPSDWDWVAYLIQSSAGSSVDIKPIKDRGVTS
ncbi:MAG: 2-C-methyl-D-erythritol 4-phosphate cytidylyltransferase [Thermoanaerobaculia bacterium]|nr:2-C-methyl-D-erythritol 4-phosphate cytidylyltransferase [Thermoanaerobaculia bacterium]